MAVALGLFERAQEVFEELRRIDVSGKSSICPFLHFLDVVDLGVMLTGWLDNSPYHLVPLV